MIACRPFVVLLVDSLLEILVEFESIAVFIVQPLEFIGSDWWAWEVTSCDCLRVLAEQHFKVFVCLLRWLARGVDFLNQVWSLNMKKSDLPFYVFKG